MKLSHTLGMTASAALLAVSGFASADVAAKNTYQANGYITSATDVAGGALCKSFGQSVGGAVKTTYLYGGPGATMTIITDGTASSGVPTTTGSAVTNVCVSRTAVPETGLNGATLTFDCYSNKVGQTKAPTSIANITSTFTAAPSSGQTKGNTVVVSANSTLVVSVLPAPNSCTFTQDAVWTAE